MVISIVPERDSAVSDPEPEKPSDRVRENGGGEKVAIPKQSHQKACRPPGFQYDFPKTTLRRDGSPVMTHVPGSSFASSGMQRTVTLRSLRTRSSTAALPFQ
jgi:hypothetical protein